MGRQARDLNAGFADASTLAGKAAQQAMTMMTVWSTEIDLILSVGLSLESIGVRNWALERDTALKAMEWLSAMGVAVVGGDVCFVSGDELEVSRDKWYCSRSIDEADADFVARSIATARNYIENYQAAPSTVLFAIVPKV